jgi:hypothetical protein
VYISRRGPVSDGSVTWQELRAELLEAGDEPEVARLRAELISRERGMLL